MDSSLYATLQVSPKKKRCPPDDDTSLTPKKMRTAPPTPPPTTSRTIFKSKQSLPASLTRLFNIQKALQRALSHALATCAISPTSDSGIIRNVLNHISVATYSGFSTTFDIDDLKRLCWLWEWDGEQLPHSKPSVDDDDNPFVTSSSSTSVPPSDWIRGSMGFVISSATHYSKTDRKRVPAYGIGIEVEIDIDKDMDSGIAAVARWTTMSDKRRSQFLSKLERWVKLHQESASLPPIPLATIPELSAPKISALTRTLASCSPSAVSPHLLHGPPSSPTRSPRKKITPGISAIPFPTLDAKSPTKQAALLFPQTPSRRGTKDGPVPQDGLTILDSSPIKTGTPSTPVHRKGSNDTLLQTPSSRRQALLERVRQRSLSASPTKSPLRALGAQSSGSKMTKDELLKLSQNAMRRKCLLGRLGGIAESVWMLFSSPTNGVCSTPSRKRKALPLNDVITAVVKSSPVPISTAEANESITMLIKLCPFFLRKLHVSGAEWLEMPAPSTVSTGSGDPTRGKTAGPISPGRLRGKNDSAHDLLHRSPKRVKKEGGGLREVREIIRKELELED